MDFSESMLIDFARAMKTDDKKGDVTLLGTVTELVDAQTTAVLLDGSTSPTLCQIAAVAGVGDKVTVLIRDHKAIITGNITNPAAAVTESSFIRVSPDGTIVIGTVDEHGDPLGFYIRATGTNYEILSRSGTKILEVTSTGVKVLNSDVLTASDVDSELNSASTNPVQNKAIWEAIQHGGGGGSGVDVSTATDVSDKMAISPMQQFNKSAMLTGKNVTFSMEVYSASLSTSAWNVVGYVDQSIYPTKLMYYPGIVTDGNFVPIGRCVLKIDTAGNMSAMSDVTGGFLFFSGTYDVDMGSISAADISSLADVLKPVKKAIVYNQEVSLNASNNTISFNMPSDFVESYGVQIVWAWPMSTWTGAGLTIVRDDTVLSGTGSVDIYAGSAQNYRIALLLLYK